MLRVPRVLKRLYAWYLRYIRRDALYAGLIEAWHEKTVEEYLALVAHREAYREQWFDMWDAHKLDFVLTVPNALPAVPHGGMKEGFKACGYTFLFNVVCNLLTEYVSSNVDAIWVSSTTPPVSCPSRTSTASSTLLRPSSNRGIPSKLASTRCMMQTRCMGSPWVSRSPGGDWKKRK